MPLEVPFNAILGAIGLNFTVEDIGKAAQFAFDQLQIGGAAQIIDWYIEGLAKLLGIKLDFTNNTLVAGLLVA